MCPRFQEWLPAIIGSRSARQNVGNSYKVEDQWLRCQKINSLPRVMILPHVKGIT